MKNSQPMTVNHQRRQVPNQLILKSPGRLWLKDRPLVSHRWVIIYWWCFIDDVIVTQLFLEEDEIAKMYQRKVGAGRKSVSAERYDPTEDDLGMTNFLWLTSMTHIYDSF